MTQWASSTRTGKRSSVTVKKMVLATVVNYSWRGRNLRTFQNKSKHANLVWAEIIEVIRFKLLSYKEKLSMRMPPSVITGGLVLTFYVEINLVFPFYC